MDRKLYYSTGFSTYLLGCAIATAVFLASSTAYAAVSGRECQAMFSSAKIAGTLNGQNYQQFKSAVCATATPPKTPKATTTTKEKTPRKKTSSTKATAIPVAIPSTSTRSVDIADVPFPTSISTKYNDQRIGRARMRTCLDQYNANKASNKNGPLKWTQKGGGYYSECVKRLKAATP